MGRRAQALAVFAVFAALALPAAAQNTDVGVDLKLDRSPSDFGRPKATKIQVDGTHTLANGAILGASFQPSYPAGRGPTTSNLEATLGYRWRLGEEISVKGSAGLGERLQPDSIGGDFAYYVLRIGADLRLNPDWTWNVLTYRYRNAFDESRRYDTPELATKLTYRIDKHQSVSAGYYYDWKEGRSDLQGIDLGYRYRF